ncbi:Crp/Fnr family transcriptional regulator [Alkalispirochaeta alkalica]|uniref:Crp/Fnr family transcriptional regulator n=1 Tax=Alkalispirochaeta alkalica TaxID=46356 RepID=UPI000366FF26|nr:Crp/Fnr family transcriptional regulator [Alkalispirochaeta alkalica]
MSDLFTHLGEDFLERLGEGLPAREIPRGTILFVEGQEGDHFFCLLRGQVRLFRSTGDGREVTLHMVEAGDLFAEIVLFERDTYPASAVAVEDSLVRAVPRGRLLGLLAEAPLREEFIRNLVGKMRFLSQQLYVLATMDVRQRLARFLAVRFGQVPLITLDLNKQETAAAISVRPETLSRALTSLKEQGLLRWSGKTITVDPRFWEDL